MPNAHFCQQHLHILANLGWRPEAVVLSTAAKRALDQLRFEVGTIHRLTTTSGALVIVRLASHQLPESHAVLGAFVETTWEVRGLLHWCAASLDADAVLLIDPAVTWLHRIAANDHCLVCPDDRSVEDRLLPIFAGESDPVAAILSRHRESTEAQGRGLRQWLLLWERRLGDACGLATADARRLIEQLVLVRRCRSLRWPRSRKPLAQALDRPLKMLDDEEVERALTQTLRVVDQLDRDLALAPCRRSPAERHRVEEALARSELTAGALLRSIELLSLDRLTASVWLAAEGEPELQSVSWRLSVENPDPMASHGSSASPHSAPRLRLDVMTVGYGHVLHTVGAAIRWVVAHNGSLSHEYATSARQSFQPDFLTLADGGADTAGFITDPIHFTLRHLVEIVATLPPQNRLMKWLLTLDLLGLIDETGLTPETFPDLDQHC